MKVFITGASGYIGCELAHHLADSGHTVHALIRAESSLKLLVHANIKVFLGDILDPESISIAMAGCRQVYHTAALVRICARDRHKFFLHNVTGTENVLKAAVHHEVERLVFTSSCGVWGITDKHIFTEKDPRVAPYDNDYEVSKVQAEKVVLDYCSKGLNCVIVNPTKVFGFGVHHHPGKVNYNSFINNWFCQRLILLPWEINVTSNLVFIQDVVQGHLLAMDRGQRGERYILGGNNVSVRNVLVTIRALVNRKKYFIRVPHAIIFLWAVFEWGASHIRKRDPLIVPAMVARLSRHAMYSSQLAMQQLGYQITPFHVAMKHTMNNAQKFRL